ncbi:MAG TPA: diguanylate cyclase [Acidimicrobiales bacterium]|nr:diguanylate cyclase [Acidimicrobiales bacterium]
MAQRIDDGALETAAASLLERHPDGLVAAINAEGLFVAMPHSMPLGEHHVMQARSALELVETPDRITVIDTWERAKEVGAANAVVRLRDGGSAVMHLVDLRHRHGTFLGLLDVIADPEGVAIDRLREHVPLPSRTVRLRKDEVAVILDADPEITEVLGWTQDDLQGFKSLDLVHPDDQERAVDSWIEMLGRPGAATRWQGRHRRKDGSWLWMEVTNHNHLDDPDRRVVEAEMIDIADQRATMEALRQREQLLARLADALPVGVLHVDLEGRILYTNDRFCSLIGVPPAGTIAEHLVGVVPADRPSVEEAIDALLHRGADSDLEVRYTAPVVGPRREQRFAVALRALTDESGAPAGAVITVADVTEAAELRRELLRRATTDELTGCLNRPAVMDVLERALATHGEGSPGTVVAFLDLDGFKSVNDALGHRAGDELLRAVSKRLLAAVRGSDVVGRIGGDEFLVVVPGVAAASGAAAVAERLARAFEQPVEVAGSLVATRCSIGTTWCGDAGADADAVVAAADRDMYRAKRAHLSRR